MKSAIALVLLLVPLCSSCCAQRSSDDTMSELGPNVVNLSSAAEAEILRPGFYTGMKDHEFFNRIVARDEQLRQDFGTYTLRYATNGKHVVVMVCSEDGQRALFEDAICTARLDNAWWKENAPCRVTLDLDSLCP